MLREMIGEATEISVISAISARNAGRQILYGILTFYVPQKEQKKQKLFLRADEHRATMREAKAISAISAISARNAGLQILHGKLTSFKVPKTREVFSLGARSKHVTLEK